MTVEIVPGYFGPQVKAKLGRQRKPQTYSVQPTDQGEIVVQSDKAIGKFDYHTGKGILNIKGSYFIHLSKLLGAEEYTFPPEFVKAVLEVAPALDEERTRGGVTVQTTIKTIG